MELHRRVSPDPIRFKWLRAGSIAMSRNRNVINPLSQEVIRLKANLSQLKNEKTGSGNGEAVYTKSTLFSGVSFSCSERFTILKTRKPASRIGNQVFSQLLISQQ